MARIPISSLDHQVLENKARSGTLDESRVRYYQDHPEEITNVVVYEDRGPGTWVVASGNHRTEAARRRGCSEIDGELRPGTRWEALCYLDLEERVPWSDLEHRAAQADTESSHG
jgi:hypothetical protein